MKFTLSYFIDFTLYKLIHMKQSFYTIKSIHFSLLLRVLVCFLLLTNPVWLSAKTSTQNYIVVKVPCQVIADPATLADVKSNSTIQYFDGLGHPIQTFRKGIIFIEKNQVDRTEYNESGRLVNNKLPTPQADGVLIVPFLYAKTEIRGKQREIFPKRLKLMIIRFSIPTTTITNNKHLPIL